MNKLIAAACAAGGALGLGLGITTTVSASLAPIPPNTYHGCVVGSDTSAIPRNLQNVYANPGSGTTCPRGFQVIWPSGPQTAGAAGLDVRAVTAPGAFNVPLDCPSDHPYAVGTGYTGLDTAPKQIMPHYDTDLGFVHGFQFSLDVASGGSVTVLCAK